ncbi:hypothetical protein EJ065_6974 [Corallococcus coralloides]|uniref:Uncharacterized protein n=1 Tax=Corallococcus coralloides TaxID=184914 RepID=A0A410S2T1_CORCK|nr:hypothetical protein [Corallococcus coralloides]QAT88499.1 hypothetical protein EJ065_6974 [Corallococcus coralloides]
MNSLEDFARWFGSNPWVSAISFLLAIAGTALSVIFYYKSRITKRPRYALRSNNIIRAFTSKVESLEILYRGRRIENLTVTKIALWNDGKATIHQNDIASLDPLIISTAKNHEILDASIIDSKNPANQLEISRIDPGKFKLSFEYLDHHEGAVLQVFHTGSTSSDIFITGIIKGAGRPERARVFNTSRMPFILPGLGDRLPAPLKRYRRLIAGVSFFIIPAFFSTAILLAPSKPTIDMERQKIINYTISSIMWLLYGGMGLFTLMRQVPKGFETFEQDF